jgi:hypothetical protein
MIFQKPTPDAPPIQVQDYEWYMTEYQDTCLRDAYDSGPNSYPPTITVVINYGDRKVKYQLLKKGR